MSYTNLQYHVVFSTKQRRPLLRGPVLPRVCEYIAGTARAVGGVLLQAGGFDNHMHLACAIPPTVAVADWIRLVKANSSKWIHETLRDSDTFAWQDGYAAFSVSNSVLPTVVQYIRTQEEHHRRMTFEEELTAILDRHGIEYDPKYVFG